MELDTSTAITSSVSTGTAFGLRSANIRDRAASPPLHPASTSTMAATAAEAEIRDVCTRMVPPLNRSHRAMGTEQRIASKQESGGLSAVPQSRIVVPSPDVSSGVVDVGQNMQ